MNQRPDVVPVFFHSARSLFPPPDVAPLLCSYRAALAVVSFVGFVNMYALRVDMSVAMVCMINQTALDELKTSSGDVPLMMNTTSIASMEINNADTDDECDVIGNADGSKTKVFFSIFMLFYSFFLSG